MRLKNDVPVTDGLDDLALQPPNGPKLIAFLKAMEFTTLTRRVAEATGTDAAASRRPRSTVETAPTRMGRMSAPATRRLPTAVAQRQPASRRAAGSAAAAARCRHGSGDTPAALAAARAQAAVGAKIDRSAYDCIRDLADARALDRRGARGRPRRLRHRDHLARPDAGRARRLLAGDRGPAAPPTCRSRTRAGDGDLLGGGLAEDQIPVREALGALKPLLEDRSVLKVGQNLKYDWLRDAPATASTSRPSTTRC